MKRFALVAVAVHTLLLGWIAMRFARIAAIEPTVRPAGAVPVSVYLSVTILAMVGLVAYGLWLALGKER